MSPLAVSAWTPCSKPHGLEVVSQHGLDLAQTFQRRNSPLGRVAQLSVFWVRLHISWMKAQPGCLGSGGVNAHQRDRRAAPMVMLCVRHSGVPDFWWFLLAAADCQCQQGARNCMWRGTCKDIEVFSIASLAFGNRLPRDNFKALA